MIRRSREINVFSMSALDLFASALGAFILISIVMIPTFPNMGPTVIVAPPPPEPVPEPMPPVRQLPPLDLVIALDVTSSMGDPISGFKAQIAQLSSLLIRMSSNVAMGVVAFGDTEWEGPICAFELREISGRTDNRTALQNFVMALSINLNEAGVTPPAGCAGLGPRGDNPTPPEAFLRALREAVNMNWRSESERKVIIMITDNPAYPHEQEEAVALAASFGATEGQEVSTVFHNSGWCCPPECGAGFLVCADIAAFLERVATEDDGYVPSGGSMTGLVLRLLL